MDLGMSFCGDCCLRQWAELPSPFSGVHILSDSRVLAPGWQTGRLGVLSLLTVLSAAVSPSCYPMTPPEEMGAKVQPHSILPPVAQNTDDRRLKGEDMCGS